MESNDDMVLHKGKQNVVDLSWCFGRFEVQSGIQYVGLHLIVTTGNSILLYNVRDSICIRSWSLKAGSKFICGAVLIGSNNIVSIDSRNKLHKFDYKADAAVSTVSLKKSVYKILNHEKLLNQFVVVYDNAVLEFYSEELKCEKKFDSNERKAKSCKVIHYEIGSTNSNENLYLLCVLSSTVNKKQIVSVQKYSMVLDTKEVELISNHVVNNDNDDILDVCFNYVVDTLTILYESKEMHIFKMGEDDLLWQFSRMLELDSKLNPTNKSPIIQSTGVSTILSLNSSNTSLKLWDTKYGVILDQLDCGGSNDQLITSLNVCTLANYVAIIRNKSAVQIYNITQESYSKRTTIADVLGKSVANDEITSANININQLLTEKSTKPNGELIIDACNAIVDKHNSYEKDVLQQLNDASTHKKFESVFNKYLSSVGDHISQQFIYSVITKCINEPKLQLWDVLDQLICKAIVSSRLCPELIPSLIQNHQLKLLYNSVLHMKDISEAHLVLSLQFIISHSSNDNLVEFYQSIQSVQPTNNKRKRKELTVVKNDSLNADENIKQLNQAELAIYYFILAIIKKPKNDIFMIKSIKSISEFELQVLLACILRTFLYYKHNYSQSTAQLAGILPSIEATLEWLTILLDSDFNKLVTQSRSNQVLQNILHEIDALCKYNLQLFYQMERISFPLRHCMQNKQLFPQGKAELKNYCIESIVL